jgi:hypothetical protein
MTAEGTCRAWWGPLTWPVSLAWLASSVLGFDDHVGSPVGGRESRKNRVSRAKRGIENVRSLPNGINTRTGKPGVASHQR